MSRALAAAIFSIVAVAGLIAWRVATPSHLYVEADTTDLAATTAAGIAAMVAAMTPSATPYRTSTPTRTPKPPTMTPLPTWAPDLTGTPIVRMVPRWTEVPPVASTVEPDLLLPCPIVTPHPYEDVPCTG